jgi:hypothetical protein
LGSFGQTEPKKIYLSSIAVAVSIFFTVSRVVVPLVASEGTMRPKERRETGQTDLLRSRLDAIIDMGHPLVKLAGAIDWTFLEQRFRDGALCRGGRHRTVDVHQAIGVADVLRYRLMKPVTIEIAALDDNGEPRTSNSWSVPTIGTALERVHDILSQRYKCLIEYDAKRETWTITHPKQGGVERLRIVRT